MFRHKEPGDDVAFQNMLFHDLRHVGFCADPIPYSFGIHDHAGSEVAVIEATGLVGTDNTF